MGREEKLGEALSDGDADPACSAMGSPSSDVNQLLVLPWIWEEKFPPHF